MKKGLLSFFIWVTAIGFASSQGLGELLGGIDESTILLFAIFIIAFSLLFFALNRVFKKENTAISGIISVVLAFLITYGISRSGFSIEDSLLDIGISQQALGIVIPLIIIAGIVFLIIKLAKDSLLVIGGLFLVAGILKLVYTYLIFIVIGAILVIVRFTVLRKEGVWERPKKKGYSGMGQM